MTNYLLLAYNKFSNDKSSVRQNEVRTSLDFPGLLLVFVEIMPDKVILDHKIFVTKYDKKSYLVSFEKKFFFQFLAKIGLK